MKRATALLRFLAAARLLAHDFWIEPTSFRPQVGETVGLALKVGQNFRGDPNAAGRVAFDLAPAGAWLLKAVHMVPAPPSSGADWESLWASLTFELP